MDIKQVQGEGEGKMKGFERRKDVHILMSRVTTQPKVI